MKELQRWIDSAKPTKEQRNFFEGLLASGLINEIAIRNEIIHRDYALHIQKGTPVMDALCHLQVNYSMSESQIRRVLADKSSIR